MPKLIDLANASTYTLGAAANVFLPSQVGSPHFNYGNMSNLLGDPTNYICTFGSKVNSYGVNGYRYVASNDRINLSRYDYIKYFVSQPGGNVTPDWGNHEPDKATTVEWYSISKKTWKNYINYVGYVSAVSSFFSTYGIFPESFDPLNSKYTLNLYTIVYFPTTATYTFSICADDDATVYVNGTSVLSQTLNVASAPTNYSVVVTAGYNIIRINLSNSGGGPNGVALQIIKPDSSILWSTSPGLYGSNAPNESIFLQYSTDNINWINLQETIPYPTGTAGWNSVSYKIPDSLKTSSVWLRILALQANPLDTTNNINNDGDNWAVSSLEGIVVTPQCPINFNDPDSYTVGDIQQCQVMLPSNINSANIGGTASPNRVMSQLGKRTDVKVGIFGSPYSDILSSENTGRTFTSTNSYTLKNYKGVSFYLNKGGGTWGDPPEDTEDFYLQYSTDNINWITISTTLASSTALNTWTKVDVLNFPDDILNTPIYFRYTMYQQVGSYRLNDNWAVSSLEFIGGA
jgi:hypothetical protein